MKDNVAVINVSVNTISGTMTSSYAILMDGDDGWNVSSTIDSKNFDSIDQCVSWIVLKVRQIETKLLKKRN